jgi:hypothetical protein
VMNRSHLSWFETAVNVLVSLVPRVVIAAIAATATARRRARLQARAGRASWRAGRPVSAYRSGTVRLVGKVNNPE